MFTSAEKKYLALTLIFLSTGTGLKAYRQSKVRLGPRPDLAFMVQDSLALLATSDSLRTVSAGDSLADLPPMAVKDSSKAEATGTHYDAEKSQSTPKKGRFNGKVSVNKANPSEFMAITGIGAKTAQLIVQYRKVHGPFGDLRQLLEVKGIGEKKLEKILPFLIL